MRDRKIEENIKQMFKIEIEFWAMELIEKRVGLKIRGDEIEQNVDLKHSIEHVTDFSSSKSSSKNFRKEDTR